MNSANDIRNKNVSLSDLCVYFDAENFRDEETGLVDKFVGLRFVDGKLSLSGEEIMLGGDETYESLCFCCFEKLKRNLITDK